MYSYDQITLGAHKTASNSASRKSTNLISEMVFLPKSFAGDLLTKLELTPSGFNHVSIPPSPGHHLWGVSRKMPPDRGF